MEQYTQGQPNVNVGQIDRFASLGVGALIGLLGLKRGWGYMVMTALGGYLLYRGLTGNCKVYEALDIDTTDMTMPDLAQMMPSGSSLGQPITVEQSVTVNRSPAEVYLFWRNLENLPRFMEYIQSVTVHGAGHSHWVAKVPFGGVPVEWEAEITEDLPDESIAWTSLPGSQVMNKGAVHFRPAQDGHATEVHVRMEYAPPGGPAGVAVAKAFNKFTAQSVKEDLLHFKEVMETGETANVEGQAAGRKSGQSADRPASSESRRHPDVVRQASEDSFPASDPPSYTAGVD